MKHTLLIGLCVAVLLPFRVAALDPLERIELRNSKKAFEDAMQLAKNDITRCLKEYRDALAKYRSALKKEPDNAEVRDYTLVLLNSLNEIAETYHAAAEKATETDAHKASTYFGKAAVCYRELARIYPKKPEFAKTAEKAEQDRDLYAVRAYLASIRNAKDLATAMIGFETLVERLDALPDGLPGRDELAADSLNLATGLAQNIDGNFENLWKAEGTKAIQNLLLLIDYHRRIGAFTGSAQHATRLAEMGQTLIDWYADTVEAFGRVERAGTAHMEKQEYEQAADALAQAVSTGRECLDRLPDTAKCPFAVAIRKLVVDARLQDRVRDALAEHRKAVYTPQLLAIIAEGDELFEKEQYTSAHTKYEKADKFARENPTAFPGLAAEREGALKAKVEEIRRKQLEALQKLLDDPAALAKVIGPKPKKSMFGGIPCVNEYLKGILHDYDSLKDMTCGDVEPQLFLLDPCYVVRCKFRTKNLLGAYVLYDATFYIQNGQVVLTDGL